MNFNIILWAVVAFLAVTLLLVLLLLFAKAKLTSSGAVKIDINGGDKVLEVESGSTLLNTLSEQGIFLPSACGGKGACGQCKCQVVAGGVPGGSVVKNLPAKFRSYWRHGFDHWVGKKTWKRK